MKTKHQLLQEWNESTYGLEFGDYVYQYFVSEFNKPPVYEIDVQKLRNTVSDAEFRKLLAGMLPPSPGSVDVEEKKECQHEALTDTGVGYHHCPTCNASFKVDGLGDSSGSTENQEQLWKEVFHQSGSRMDFMQFLQKHFTINRKP